MNGLLDETGKAQVIRLADVVFVGPLMIWAGWTLRERHPVGGFAMVALGAGTIALNGYNFYRFGGLR